MTFLFDIANLKKRKNIWTYYILFKIKRRALDVMKSLGRIYTFHPMLTHSKPKIAKLKKG